MKPLTPTEMHGMRRDARNLIVVHTDAGELHFHADIEIDEEGNHLPILRHILEPAATALEP